MLARIHDPSQEVRFSSSEHGRILLSCNDAMTSADLGKIWRIVQACKWNFLNLTPVLLNVPHMLNPHEWDLWNSTMWPTIGNLDCSKYMTSPWDEMPVNFTSTKVGPIIRLGTWLRMQLNTWIIVHKIMLIML